MKTIAILICAATCTACASAPVPTQRYANANAAIRSAEVMNAESVPSAALHLRLAREQLDKGQRLMREGENERAKFVLMRAEADGQAALNLAREAAAKQEAAQAIQQAQQARSQMEGATP